MLSVGDPAPDFELPADDGSTVRLSALRGRTVVLFFYPRVNTPTCTVEACGFRDREESFADADAVVLGISPDSPKAVARFHARYALSYRLLADAEHEVAERYGVWQEKQLFGRRYMGVERTTFVIAPDGRVARVYRKVNATRHAAEVLSDLDASG